ncbi:MAG: hypothetical protein AAF318_01325 [Pseudomonadota bacterium]
MADPTDAASVVARANTRLAEAERLAGRISRADRARLAQALSGQLGTLAASPLVSGDLHAEALLADLSRAQNGEQLAALFAPLAEHLTQKAEEHLSARVEAGDTHPSALDAFRHSVVGGRQRPPAASAPMPGPADDAAAAPQRPRRTVLHL